MRSMIIKMVLLGLMLFLCKASVLGQDTDVKCEISSFDYNLSGSKALSEFGSFLIFAEGKEVKGKESAVMITKYYKFPRTKLILSILGWVYVPKGETSDDIFDNTLAIQMILGKKRIAPSPDFDEENWMNDAVSIVAASFTMRNFDEGGKGKLSSVFLGKKKPVAITMTCKKKGS